MKNQGPCPSVNELLKYLTNATGFLVPSSAGYGDDQDRQAKHALLEELRARQEMQTWQIFTGEYRTMNGINKYPQGQAESA